MPNNRISVLVALEGADEGLKRAVNSAECSLGRPLLLVQKEGLSSEKVQYVRATGVSAVAPVLGGARDAHLLAPTRLGSPQGRRLRPPTK